MAFTFSNLLQDFYVDTGIVDPKSGIFTATGGSTTTFVNTAFASLESPPEETSLVGSLAIVVKDAGGAAAAPESEYGLISAYVESTGTGTIATLTAGIASGDTIMIASQKAFPVQMVMFQANRALSELGDMVYPDTSLTSGSSQTEYDLPVTLKRRPPRKIEYQGVTGDSNANEWIEITNWRYESSAPGSVGKLILPQLPSGRTIKLHPERVHPDLTAYSSVISENIHPRVAVAATILKALEWHNRQDANQDPQSYFLWLEGEYRNKHLPIALLENPIWKPPREAKTFSRGRHRKPYPGDQSIYDR